MTREVVIERRYDQGPGAVFNAWIDVDLLRQWFGCGPDTLWEIHEWEPVPGGPLRVSMEMDGRTVEITGEFLEVNPPSRLRYRWGDDQAVTADFAPDGAGCRLVITHEGLPPGDMSGIVTEGWTVSVEQLAAVASAAAAIEQVGQELPDRR